MKYLDQLKIREDWLLLNPRDFNPIPNTPTPGVKILGAGKFGELLDPRGFKVRVNLTSLMDLISVSTVINGEVQEPIIYLAGQSVHVVKYHPCWEKPKKISKTSLEVNAVYYHKRLGHLTFAGFADTFIGKNFRGDYDKHEGVAIFQLEDELLCTKSLSSLIWKEDYQLVCKNPTLTWHTSYLERIDYRPNPNSRYYRVGDVNYDADRQSRMTKMWKYDRWIGQSKMPSKTNPVDVIFVFANGTELNRKEISYSLLYHLDRNA